MRIRKVLVATLFGAALTFGSSSQAAVLFQDSFDMDGSSGDAGRITSIATFTLTAGVSYTLSGQVSGNQRGAAADSISLGLLDSITGNPLIEFTYSSIASGASFGTQSTTVTFLKNQTVRLFFEGVGGDNYGVILDNVLFVDDGSSTAVSEPGTALLGGLGLLLAAMHRRRIRG